MNILSISAFYYESTACSPQEVEIIAAAREENFTHKKHDANSPNHAILSFDLNCPEIVAVE